MKQRQEIRKVTESEVTGERVTFHGVKFGRLWRYGVGLFGRGGDYTPIYEGQSRKDAESIFREYREEFESN